MFGTKLKVAAGVAVGALLTGGFAYAAIPASDGTVHACYKTSGGLLSGPSGAVRIVDHASDCNPGETAIAWNQAGPRGPIGPAGKDGTSATIPPQSCPPGASVIGIDSSGSLVCHAYAPHVVREAPDDGTNDPPTGAQIVGTTLPLVLDGEINDRGPGGSDSDWWHLTQPMTAGQHLVVSCDGGGELLTVRSADVSSRFLASNLPCVGGTTDITLDVAEPDGLLFAISSCCIGFPSSYTVAIELT